MNNKFEQKIEKYQKLIEILNENSENGICILSQKELATKLSEAFEITSPSTISQMLKMMNDNMHITKLQGYRIECKDIFEIKYFQILKRIISDFREKPELKQMREMELCEKYNVDLKTIQAAKGYISNEL